MGGGGGIPACTAGGIPSCLAAGLRGWYPSMPCRFPGPTPRGEVEESGQGSGPHPGGLQVHTWGVPVPGGSASRGGACSGVSAPRGGMWRPP